MFDFSRFLPTMSLTGPEDRALLGSNPSAAAGDGNHRGSWPYYGWLLLPQSSSRGSCPKSDKPILFAIAKPGQNQARNPTGLPFGKIFRAPTRS
jgi:hypothetical protein